jgi:DNA polymerase-3 subunit epsilon
MNFIAIDVETANADFASICSVGMVYFKDGVVERRLGFLIDPEDEFDPVNVSIHGIRPEDVIGAPNMRTAFPQITSALATTTVVHHTHFDRVAFSRAASKFGFPQPTCNWLDSARVARRAWQQFSRRGYGLANLAAAFGIEFKHHDATGDAYAAGMILLRAISETGVSLNDWLVRIEQPICAGDGHHAHGHHARAGNPFGPRSGEVIVFTGQLQVPRNKAAELAAQAGCEVADGVTKRTTILVVGDQDIRVLNGHAKSSKHRKAETLIQEGSSLRIVGESDFCRLVGSG